MKKFVFWRKLTGDSVEDNFSAKPEYHAFFALCNQHFEFRIATGQESYAGNGLFKNVFAYRDWKIIPAETEFKADVVYQRKKLTDNAFDRAVPIVDSPEFKDWCPDKWNQYELLNEFMPQTFVIKTETDLQNNLANVKTSKAVLKPRRGEKGENVLVFDKNQVPTMDQKILETRGYLLQEFVDTDVNVEGVVVGLHDIKLITVGDRVFANLRVPEVGKNYCTFDSPYTELPLNKLSSGVLELHQKVKNKIESRFSGQLYTVDIGLTKNGPIVFELNSHTAFPYLHFNYAQEFFDSLIKHLDAISN